MSEAPAQDVVSHCREIDRCNQRGGRMLSIADLLNAGTLTTDLAAYCIAAVSEGRSFLIGASPGGAGKTTVMGALLNFVPPDVRLAAATEDNLEAPDRGRMCWIGHEIGRGPYYAYLWGSPLRAWFARARKGAMLASNLHADTMGEVETQVIIQNGVAREDLRMIGFILFLTVQHAAHGYTRTVIEALESDGTHDHVPLWSATAGSLAPSALVTSERQRWASSILQRLAHDGCRTIDEVRATFLEECSLQNAPGPI